MSRGIDGTFLKFTITTRRRANIGTPLSTPLPPKTGAKKVREIAALKMEYIVVMATALYDRCYFESSVFPLADIPCADPIEAVLDEADKCGIKVFLGNGFYGDWTKPGVNITSSEVIDRSFKAMDELTEKYARHKSFYGWYFPDETCIILRFSGNFMKYVNLLRPLPRDNARQKTLIAPLRHKSCAHKLEIYRRARLARCRFHCVSGRNRRQKTRVWQSEKIFARLKKPMIKPVAPRSGLISSCSNSRGMVYKKRPAPRRFRAHRAADSERRAVCGQDNRISVYRADESRGFRLVRRA